MPALVKGDYPGKHLSRRCPDQRSGRVLLALCAVYPDKISAWHLMGRAGLSWRAEPVWSFVCLCNDFIKINQALFGTGWQAVRSGGTPDDHYWLLPSGDG